MSGKKEYKGCTNSEFNLCGKVRIIQDKEVLDDNERYKNNIYIMNSLNVDIVATLIKNASAVVCQSGQLTEDAVRYCMDQGCPIVVNAKGIMKAVCNDDILYINARNGIAKIRVSQDSQ